MIILIYHYTFNNSNNLRSNPLTENTPRLHPDRIPFTPSSTPFAQFMQEFQKIVKLSNKTNPTTSPVTTGGKTKESSLPAHVEVKVKPKPDASAVAIAAAASSSSVTTAVTTLPSATAPTAKLTNLNGATVNEQLKYENDRLKIALALRFVVRDLRACTA